MKKTSKNPKSNLAGKRPRDSEVNMTQMVLPQHSNASGTVFGGTLVSWIDIAAAVAAMRHAGRVCVTASIDEMHFLRPLRVGQVVNIHAKITMVNKSSCEIMVNVCGENPIEGERFFIAHAFLTFVALDENRKPTAMPGLLLESAEEKKLELDGFTRREQRLKLKQLIGKNNATAL